MNILLLVDTYLLHRLKNKKLPENKTSYFSYKLILFFIKVASYLSAPYL